MYVTHADTHADMSLSALREWTCLLPMHHFGFAAEAIVSISCHVKRDACDQQSEDLVLTWYLHSQGPFVGLGTSWNTVRRGRMTDVPLLERVQEPQQFSWLLV